MKKVDLVVVVPYGSEFYVAQLMVQNSIQYTIPAIGILIGENPYYPLWKTGEFPN